MKYLSQKQTAFLLGASFVVFGGIYLIPMGLENLLLTKIITISYIVIGTVLATLFFLVNGASTAIVDGEYEKSYYASLKKGAADTEGENMHWNPLKLSLAKRIYYSKILLCLLFPIVAIFFIEYIAILISHLK